MPKESFHKKSLVKNRNVDFDSLHRDKTIPKLSKVEKMVESELKID